MAEDAHWAEAEGFREADVFARAPVVSDPAGDCYRRPSDDETRELTCVDEDTFWSGF